MAVGRQQAALPRPVHRRGLEVDGRGDAVRLDGRLDEADARVLGQRRRIDQPHPRGRVHAVTAQRQIANRTRAVLEENRHRLARLDAVYHFLAELDLDVAGLLGRRQHRQVKRYPHHAPRLIPAVSFAVLAGKVNPAQSPAGMDGKQLDRLDLDAPVGSHLVELLQHAQVVEMALGGRVQVDGTPRRRWHIVKLEDGDLKVRYLLRELPGKRKGGCYACYAAAQDEDIARRSHGYHEAREIIRERNATAMNMQLQLNELPNRTTAFREQQQS